MYINPFAAGVIATIVIELVLIIGVALYMGNHKN